MSDAPSTLEKALPWLALVAGLGGVAYVARDSLSAPAPARTKASAKASAKGSAARAPKGRARAPSAYNRFVQDEMPGLLAKGYTSPNAMAEIGRRWKAKQGRG